MNKSLPLAALIVGMMAALGYSSPVVELRVEVDDLGGNPISSIAAGQDFELKVVVQDVRDPADQFPGVFAAYLDVSFDSTLADVAPSTIPVFGPTFLPYLGGASYNLGHSLTTATINAGSFSTSLTPPGNAPQLLYTIKAHAQAPGVEEFLPTFTANPGMEVILYDPPDVLTPDDLRFLGATLTIVPEPPTFLLAGCAVAVFIGWAACTRGKVNPQSPRRIHSVQQ